ncbi:serine/threonine-protein kinase RIO3 [Cylas formicarius]|uniref:serine/threonine-protein kinase RIO3 n=1 Tax=Cylas formicarius TaxID=197179 RepID=UPI00295851FC|nr:serine/threonine-protein kinase RIO3 [Cylas formicarius]
MSCPWAKIEKPETVNLSEIMSEEVARDLQDKENKKYAQVRSASEQSNSFEVPLDIPEDVLAAVSESTEESDALIAHMLQMQFDKEYDDMLTKTEKKYNGDCKISVSFENFRRAPRNSDFESESEEDEVEDIMERKDWDRFDILQREVASIPPCGYKVQENGILTKHDLVNSGRKNACKLLSFPPEFRTGDGEDFDLKLSNKVFNSLKMHSRNEQFRSYKHKDKKEDRATAEFGLDSFTRLLLYKMINNQQLLERINGVISIGKEAVILHAETDQANPEAQSLPKECVIKVYKTTLSEFKDREKYINDDYRFKDRIGKQNARKMVHLWAEKEMANLTRLHKAGIRCPDVIKLKQHMLVMSFIGDNNRPAPKLKDGPKKFEDLAAAYDEVTEGMKTMYHQANLIHADLSEYNILWHEKECYFIDVSQAVEPTHENAFSFLFRDCYNISKFFSKKGVPNLLSPDELFRDITGVEYSDKLALASIQEAFKMKPHLVDKPGYEPTTSFDTLWDKAQSGELPIVEKAIKDEQLELVEPPQA